MPACRFTELLAAHEREVEVLRHLSSDDLKQRWLALKGVPLPKYMRCELMARALAHAEREHRDGGLDAATRKQLEALAAAIVPNGAAAPARVPVRRLRAGTRLLREWQGRVYEVAVERDGFVLNGKRYGSLSEIARLITGSRWNGWLFFGLKDRKGAAKARPRQTGRAAHA